MAIEIYTGLRKSVFALTDGLGNITTLYLLSELPAKEQRELAATDEYMRLERLLTEAQTISEHNTRIVAGGGEPTVPPQELTLGIDDANFAFESLAIAKAVRKNKVSLDAAVQEALKAQNESAVLHWLEANGQPLTVAEAGALSSPVRGRIRAQQNLWARQATDEVALGERSTTPPNGDG